MSNPTTDTIQVLHYQRSLLNLVGAVEALEQDPSGASRPDAKPPATEPGSILESWARRLEQPRSIAG
jgi:hypothetical protein